jgi:hypothetical protein
VNLTNKSACVDVVARPQQTRSRILGIRVDATERLRGA